MKRETCKESRRVSYGHMGLRLAAKDHTVMSSQTGETWEYSRLRSLPLEHQTSYPSEKCVEETIESINHTLKVCAKILQLIYQWILIVHQY